MSTLDQQLQTCLCNCTSNYQQHLWSLPPCHQHQSQPQPPHCQFLLSLLCCRLSQLHQRATNILDCKPFQKKMNLPSQSKKDSRMRLWQTTKIRQLTIQQQEKEEKELVNFWTTTFEQLLDVWPFHPQQVVELGRMRYCLTRLDKEQLKSLGLQNLFRMAWLKPDPPHSGPGRWKKIYK
jgi:hypothetical protein